MCKGGGWGGCATYCMKIEVLSFLLFHFLLLLKRPVHFLPLSILTISFYHIALNVHLYIINTHTT